MLAKYDKNRKQNDRFGNIGEHRTSRRRQSCSLIALPFSSCLSHGIAFCPHEKNRQWDMVESPSSRF